MPNDLDHRSAPDYAAALAVAGAARIRPIETAEEYAACVALQSETWGEAFTDVVPASLMRVASRIGGLAAGAFDEDGMLVGFVFGLTGVRDGELVHWSHMLGVRREFRGAGVGRKLKEYQRDELARRGIGRIYWTFDPLQAQNAHLNLNRLHVRVLDYVQNMYGASTSPLHFGLETDRLIVTCLTDDSRNSQSRSAMAQPESLPILTPFPRAGDRLLDQNVDGFAGAFIEIPFDIEELFTRSRDDAAEWRLSTRKHLQWVLRRGYTVTALARDPDTTRAFYVIQGDESRSAITAG